MTQEKNSSKLLSDQTKQISGEIQMSHLNCNISCKKQKQLTYEERIKLEALYKMGFTPTIIGEQLGGRSERTVRREIARGKVTLLNSDLTERQAYSTEIGQIV